MGLKDLFSSSGRSKSRLDKLIRRVENKYAQSADRYDAMQKLLEGPGVPEVVGLLRRFTISASKSIEDEEEKGWLYRRLTGLPADVMLPGVKQFCLSSELISSLGPERQSGWGWALRIVEDLADEQQEWDILDALLEKHPPGYERDPSKKVQLLTHVSEIEDPRVPEILSAYLSDADENVRFFCVEALIDIADERAKELLVKRLCDPAEDFLRLRTAILNGLAALKWDVGSYRSDLHANLGNEGHSLEGNVIKAP